MNALANLLANDVLRELNYRDLTISELPIEITFVLRWYIIRRVKGPKKGQLGHDSNFPKSKPGKMSTDKKRGMCLCRLLRGQGAVYELNSVLYRDRERAVDSHLDTYRLFTDWST